MKRKIQKKLFLLGIIISIIPVSIMCTFFTISNLNNNGASKPINISESKNNTIDNKQSQDFLSYSLNGTVVEKVSTFSFIPIANIPWANTKKADEVSPKEIESILVPSNSDAIFHVEIVTVDLVNGEITFSIFQTLRTFTNGTVTALTPHEIPTQPNGTDKKWKTPTGLIIADKYNFSWRNNQEIASFLRSTTFTTKQLTKEVVVSELVNSGPDFKLPELVNTEVIISDVSTNSQDLYGVAKIIINFPNVMTNSWVNNTPPTLAQRTLIVRGLNNASGNKSEMNFLQLKSSQTLGAISIADKSVFGNVLLDNENLIKDLYPSEFISIGSPNIFSLINMFEKGTYLSNSEKIVDLNYMGLSFGDVNFSAITGIEPTTVTELGLSNIISEYENSDGSLKLIYEYKYYDIFSNSIMENNSYQIFAPSTFNINPDANKSLILDWKTNADVQTMGSSYEIVNRYNTNIANPNLTPIEKNDFIRDYSNNFFNGSNDAYAKNREKFSIEYKGGSKILNGEYVPISNNPNDFNQIEVSVTFDSWNGHIYTDKITNQRKNGLQLSITYSMSSYKYESNLIHWKTPQSLINLHNKTPSEIAYGISKKEIPVDRFFSITGSSQIETIVQPNDLLGSLNFKIIANAGTANVQVYQNVFSGFTVSKIGENIIDFGWLPQIDLPKSITSKPLLDVTDDEIMTFLLNNYSLLQNGILTTNDIKIHRDINENSIFIEITFNFFNQEIAVPGTQTFYTQLVGFPKTISDNIMETKEPLNLTLILVIGLGGIIGLPLLIYFIILLTKYIKYNKNKKQSESKRDKEK